MKKIGWNIKSQILILIYEISGSFDTAVDNNLESLFNIVLIVEFSPVFSTKHWRSIYGVLYKELGWTQISQRDRDRELKRGNSHVVVIQTNYVYWRTSKQALFISDCSNRPEFVTAKDRIRCKLL